MPKFDFDHMELKNATDINKFFKLSIAKHVDI